MNSERKLLEVPINDGSLTVAHWVAEGPRILLVHGISSSHMAWYDIANSLHDEGYDIILRFAWNAMRLPTNYSLRASSLFGDNDTITNVGLGLNHNGKLLLTAGVQVDYLRVGLDLSANGLKTTGEILSLELPDAPQAVIPF